MITFVRHIPVYIYIYSEYSRLKPVYKDYRTHFEQQEH